VMPVDVVEQLGRLGDALTSRHEPITVEQIERRVASGVRRRPSAIVDVTLETDRSTRRDDVADVRPARRRWWLAAAAAVVVAGCGLAVAVWERDAPAPRPTDAPPTPATGPDGSDMPVSTAPAVMIDQPAPDVSGELLGLGEFSLSDLRGHWLVLGFVDPSCDDCAEQQAVLSRLEDDLLARRGD